jgi:hypothetical protein
MRLYTGSEPGADAGAPGGSASYADILSDFPGWFTGQANAALYCGNLIPGSSTAGTTSPGTHAGFLQQLAALAGGTYNVIP